MFALRVAIPAVLAVGVGVAALVTPTGLATKTPARYSDAVGVGSGPRGVTVHPDGSRVYVANLFTDTVSVIDASSESVTATIPVGLRFSGIGSSVAPQDATPSLAGACRSRSFAARF